MGYDDNPPLNPHYLDEGSLYQRQRVEDDDINSSIPPNSQKTKSANITPRQVGGAAVAGAVAGLALSGPVVGVAAGGAAAYAATRKSGVAGGVARQTGEVVITAGEKAKDLNDRHRISTRSVSLAKSTVRNAQELDERHQILQTTKRMANNAVVTARDVDKKHRVTDKTKKASGLAMDKAKDVNERYRVTEKTRGVALAATKQGALGVKFMSRYMASKKSSS